MNAGLIAFDDDLPKALVDGLERGAFGYDFLDKLDRELVAHVQAS